MKTATTLISNDRKFVDLLVSQFWKLGYFTISRRYGTYLPEPEKIGKYKIDLLGRQKNKYAIGITLTKEDLYDRELVEKLSYLSSRKTKFSKSPVLLVVGIPSGLIKKLRIVVNRLTEDEKSNIKVVPIVEQITKSTLSARKSKPVLFS